MPYFRIYDDTIFDSVEYNGNYTLKIIGGNIPTEDIISYSSKEIEDFNIDKLLIW